MKFLSRLFANIYYLRAFSLFQFFIKAAVFWFDYYLGKGKSLYPINITIDITYQCNLNCRFCFLKSSVLNESQERNELSLNRIIALIDEVKKYKTSFFITGGEPFIRDDLIDIAGVIKKNGLRCGINTNGLLINKEKAEKLCEIDLDYLYVSVDSSFNNGKNIKFITSHSKSPNVLINFIVSEESVDKLDKLLDFAEETKVTGIFLQFLSYLTKKDISMNTPFCNSYFPGIQNSMLEQQPFSEDIKSAICNNVNSFKKKAKAAGIPVFFSPRELSDTQMLKWYSDEFLFLNNCKYVWNVARISPSGDVYPCYMYRIPMGNINEDSFFKIWNNRQFTDFRKLLREKGVFPGCNRCCKL